MSINVSFWICLLLAMIHVHEVHVTGFSVFDCTFMFIMYTKMPVCKLPVCLTLHGHLIH